MRLNIWIDTTSRQLNGTLISNCALHIMFPKQRFEPRGKIMLPKHICGVLCDHSGVAGERGQPTDIGQGTGVDPSVLPSCRDLPRLGASIVTQFAELLMPRKIEGSLKMLLGAGTGACPRPCYGGHGIPTTHSAQLHDSPGLHTNKDRLSPFTPI